MTGMASQETGLSGNGIIDRYPLEKLLIFTKETFQKLKSELAAGRPKEQAKSPKDPGIKPAPVPKTQLPSKIRNSFEPSQISHAYDSDYWRWQRVAEWFKEYAQDYE